MNQKLSSWWEEKTQHPYVAKRSLIAPAHADKFAPFTHFIVYYCGADFSPPQIPLQGAELGYLIQGEKEPPNTPDQDPWVPRAEQLLDVVGGALRQDPVEIIPVLYVSMGFGKQDTTRSFSSDQVPINEDANRTVRDSVYFDRIVGLSMLDEELNRADTVVVSIALCKDTEGLVKARLLEPESLLINISRGGTVDLTDARCRLVLDVFEEEPLPEDSPLWEAATVTPHNSFIGEGNGDRLYRLIKSNLEKAQ